MTLTVRVTVAALVVGATIVGLSGCDQQGWSASTRSMSTGSFGDVPRAASVANVTISWMPPDTNVDGSALTNLAGYRIHYGIDARALTSEVDVQTPGLTDYVVDNLKPNTTYYFAVSTYNSAGVESSNSPVVSVTTL
jgi:hypothetical protein